MKDFLDFCTRLGVHDIARRARLLRCSVGIGYHDVVLFFICGHDFIFAPADAKFNAIVRLFIGPGDVPYALNLSAKGRNEFFRQLMRPEVALHLELAGDHKIQNFGYRGGLSPTRDAANYNLQTRALDWLARAQVNHENSLDAPIAALPDACRHAPAAHADATISQMRLDLAAAGWPGPLDRLGL